MRIANELVPKLLTTLAAATSPDTAEAPSFSHSFLTSYRADWTFTRSNTQTFENHEGTILTAEDGEAAFVGARCDRNIAPALNDVTNVGWVRTGASGGPTETAPNQLDFVAATGPSWGQYDVWYYNIPAAQATGGEVHIWTVTLSGDVDGETLELLLDGSGGSQTQETITLTTTPTRYSLQRKVPAGGEPSWGPAAYIRRRQANTATRVYVDDAVLQVVYGNTPNRMPCDPIENGVVYYDGDNANYINWVERNDDYDHADWGEQNATLTDNGDGTGTVDGLIVGATDIVFWDAFGAQDIEGRTFRGAIELKGEGVDIGRQVTVSLKRAGGGSFVESAIQVTLTSEFQRVDTGLITGLADNLGARLQIFGSGTNATSVVTKEWHIEEMTGKGVQTLNPYVDYMRIGSGTATALTGLKGILLEGAGTNECTYSRTLDTANNWQMNGTGITQTLNDAVSPFGTMTATKIDATTTTGYVQYRILVTVTANTEYTFSWYALLGTATVVDYRVYDNSNAADIIATTPYGSELNTSTYTRVEKTFTTPAGCTSIACYVAAGFESPRFDGTIWCDGVQVEEGNFATSQIDTTSTPLSRTATQLDRNWTLPANNMSYFVEFVVNHDETDLVAGGKRIIEFDDGTVDHRALSYFQNGSGLFQGQKRTNGGFASLATHPTLGYVKGDTITVAFTANETQTAQWLNGTAKRLLTTAIATVDWTSIPTQIGLGYSASAGVGAANAFISIKTVKVWNEEKTDTFLAGL